MERTLDLIEVFTVGLMIIYICNVGMLVTDFHVSTIRKMSSSNYPEKKTEAEFLYKGELYSTDIRYNSKIIKSK